MDRWIGKIALVTGASVGIGASIVKRLVNNGMIVVTVARSLDKMKALEKELKGKEGAVIPIKCNLRNEEEIIEVFKYIKKEFGGVDILINNAGLAKPTPLLDPKGKTSDFREMLDVNVLALAICTREAYKIMKENNVQEGHIINITGQASKIVFNDPYTHFYSATKFAVHALCSGIRNELKSANSRIRMTEISPGLVETEFVYRMEGKVTNYFDDHKALKPADISGAVIYVLGLSQDIEVDEVGVRPT